MSKSQRTKGHGFERKLAQQLRDRGIFPEARRLLEYHPDDARGIDLQNTGNLAIQAKCRKTYVSVNTINEVQANGRIPVLVTKADYKPPMVVMPWDDFLRILANVMEAYE